MQHLSTMSSVSRRALSVVLTLVLLALLGGLTAQAVTQVYDGGDGDWSTTDTNWDGGGTWTNTNTATFGGTAGAVTLTEDITVGDGSVGNIIRFNTSGYTLDADPGSSLTIKVPTSGRIEAVYGRNTTIDAPIIFDAGGNDVVFRNEAGIVTINGDISGNGKFWAWQQSNIASQKTILNGDNSFTGGVSGYSWGTLVVGSNTALGTGSLNWQNGNRLEAGSANPTVANGIKFSNDPNVTFYGPNSLTFSSDQTYYPGNSATFRVDDAAATLTFASLTEFVHYVNGPFEKTGPGTLAITGQYGNGGTTTVTAGTLILNGPTGNKNGGGGYDPMLGYVVAPGATLGGNGTINVAALAKVTVSAGGELSPGESIGTLTVNGDVDLFGTLLIEVDSQAAGQQADLLVVNGALDLTGSSLIVSGDGSVLGEFTLMTVAGGLGSVTGDFASTDYSGLTGLAGITKLFWDGDNLVLSTVPEPASVALMALIGLTVFRRRRG